MALRSCLSLVILYHVVQSSSHRELDGKYRPYGPMRCIQVCQDSTNFSKSINRYRCHRDAKSNSQDPTEEAFICLDEKMVNISTTASSILTHKLKECSPVVGKIQRTTKITAVRCNAVELIDACWEGRLDDVRDIVSRKLEDINCRGMNGITPVMEAARYREWAIFQFLVSQGCDLLASDDDSQTVLHAACAGGKTNIVLKLVDDMNIELESRNKFGETPVMLASKNCHVKVVQLLHSKGCNMTAINKANDNILHHASSGGCLHVVRYILSKRIISIESRGEDGQTPVMAAATSCEIRVVKLLATKGCNLTEVDNLNNNILHHASYGRCLHVVRYILSKRIISIESRGGYGKTPVIAAASQCGIKVAKFLAAKGCNLTEVDDQNDNILHHACSGGCLHVVRYILSQRIIGIESRGEDGQTPVIAAVSYCELSLVKFLAVKGCNLTEVDNLNNNILHHASYEGCLHVARYILSKRIIGIESRGDGGRTPVIAAASNCELRLVKLLAVKGCNLTEVDNLNNNILHHVSYEGCLHVVRYILSKRIISIESKGEGGRTPVMAAAIFWNLRNAMLLAAKGRNLTEFLKNKILHYYAKCSDVVSDSMQYLNFCLTSSEKDGQTPVAAASCKCKTKLVMFLASKGCNLSEVDSQNNNILHVAVMSGCYNIVKYIVSQDIIDTGNKNGNGQTPLEIAEGYVDRDMVELLTPKMGGN